MGDQEEDQSLIMGDQRFLKSGLGWGGGGIDGWGEEGGCRGEA